MGTIEPLKEFEDMIWRLCPQSKNVRVIIQDMDQPLACASQIIFNREPVCSIPEEEGDEVEVVEVRGRATLPVVRAGKPSPADRLMLAEVEGNPGLKSENLARRLGIASVTARKRLGRMVNLGWVTSSHSAGYSITPAGQAAMHL